MRLHNLIFVFACLCLGAQNMYSQVPTYVPTDNLLAWYAFGGNTTDATANGFDGNAIDVTPISDRGGNEGEAFFFNGESSEIVVPFESVFNSFPFTVSLWCKLAEDTDGGVLIQRYTNASWNGWVMSVDNTDGDSQTISPGYMLQSPPNCNGVVSNAQCGTGINYTDDMYDQMWHMLTFTVDGDSGRFYFDGILRTTQQWSGVPGPPDGISDLRIGGTDMGSSFFFHGALDDVGIWDRALSNSEVDAMFNGLPPTAGCTNANACNYAPDATINDGSCVLDCNGCIDPCACNYNQNAAHDDGSCDYTCHQGMSFIKVFHDENNNGIFDGGERPMQYWPVEIMELEKIVYTNADGMVVMPLPEGVIHYGLLSASAEWTPTTPAEAEVIVPGVTEVVFGLRHISGLPSAEVEELLGYYDYLHCDYGMESGLYVRNIGGQVLHGVITLNCDAAYTPLAAASLSVPPNITGLGFAQWDIAALQPWETQLLAFHLEGPGSSAAGQVFSYTLTVELRDVLEQIVYTGSINGSKQIQCDEPVSQLATDPEGFNESFHYVPDGAELSFRVQFLNNTEEWADNFMVIQNLNSQQFDLNTFELVYASESLVGCLHDDGTIDLQFSDLTSSPAPLNLNRLGAYALYRVRLNDGITPDSTFYHSMHVVLGLDSTISSDIIYHTIYDCDQLAGIIGEDVYCEGDTVILRSNEIWIDGYGWFINDSLFSNESEIQVVLEPGFYHVIAEFSNPLCSVSVPKSITISEAPNAEVVLSGDELLSTGDYYCQWYFNNELLQGETNSTLSISSEGVYYAVWTTSMGCEARSDKILINNLSEAENDVQLYPNPSNGLVRIELPIGLYHVSVFDIRGRRVYENETFSPTAWLDVTSLTGGIYRVLATSGNQNFLTTLTIN